MMREYRGRGRPGGSRCCRHEMVFIFKSGRVAKMRGLRAKEVRVYKYK